MAGFSSKKRTRPKSHPNTAARQDTSQYTGFMQKAEFHRVLLGQREDTGNNEEQGRYVMYGSKGVHKNVQ